MQWIYLIFFSFPFQFMVALQTGGDFLAFRAAGTSHELG